MGGKVWFLTFCFILIEADKIQPAAQFDVCPPFHLKPVKHQSNLAVGANPSVNPDRSIGNSIGS